MHGAIEVAFIGRAGQDAGELKVSAAGKPWARLSLAVGADDATQWVSVAVFGEVAQRLCQTLHKGDRLYVEGTLRLAGAMARSARAYRSPPGRPRSSAPSDATNRRRRGRRRPGRTTSRATLPPQLTATDRR